MISASSRFRVKGVNSKHIILWKIVEQEAWRDDLHDFLPACFLLEPDGK
jgi:hypothetical protein